MAPSHGTEDLGRLVEAAAAVAGATDLSAVLRRTVRTAMQLTGARYGALGVLGSHGTLVEFVHAGLDDDTAAAIGPPPRGRGVLGVITRRRQPLRLDSIDSHPDAVGFPPNHPVMETFLGMPVRAGDEVFGNLYLTDKPGGFGEEDERLIEALAAIAGSAIATSRLHERLRRMAVVEDRERIARDLHDAIIQEIFAVGLSLSMMSQRVEDPEASSSLADAAGRLDEVITALRRFIFDLHPPIWARRSLKDELPPLLDQLGASHGSEVGLSLTGDIDLLPDRQVDDVVQVVREAVSNALRHAGARRVEVAVVGEPEQLTLTVNDDGSGFDLDRAKRGMGLSNLSERAELAGGEATITSRPDFGTTVRVRIPLI